MFTLALKSGVCISDNALVPVLQLLHVLQVPIPQVLSLQVITLCAKMWSGSMGLAAEDKLAALVGR